MITVTVPLGVMRPMRSLASVNHKLPSGPAVMELGCELALMPLENSVTVPLGAMRPIRLPLTSAARRLFN